MELTTEVLDRLREDMRKALKSVECAYDIKFNGINFTYSPVDCSVKMTFDRTDINAGEYRLNQFAAMNGYDNLYNKTVLVQGHSVKLKDFDPKARKWKILGEDLSTGKGVKLTLDAIAGFKIVAHVKIDY